MYLSQTMPPEPRFKNCSKLTINQKNDNDVKIFQRKEIQKTAEATGDFTGNKFAGRITKVLQKFATEYLRNSYNLA